MTDVNRESKHQVMSKGPGALQTVLISYPTLSESSRSCNHRTLTLAHVVVIKDFVGYFVLSLQRANEVDFTEMFSIDLKPKERTRSYTQLNPLVLYRAGW